MTIDDIKTKINQIKSVKTDDGFAHEIEDDLRDSFIKFVAENGDENLKQMALEILKTKDIDFTRWYE